MAAEPVPLGKPPAADAGRDAVHVAIFPATSNTEILPGEHVCLIKDTTDMVVPCGPGRSIGIVDPFLTDPVMRGERFYVLLKPNTVTGLRHEWTHPAFAAERPKPASVPKDVHPRSGPKPRWMKAAGSKPS